MTTKTTLLMAALAGVGATVLATAPVAAQDRNVPEIVITPSGPGGTGVYGAYGRDLPGVYMLSNNGLPSTPTISEGQVPLPGNDLIPNRYTYNDPLNRPLPILDAWHGTQGGGFPF